MSEGDSMAGSPELSLVTSRIGDEAFDVTHYVVRDWQLFIVRGDITGDAWQVVTDAVDKSVVTGATRHIVDLARVSAVNPLCVEALARIDRQLRRAGGDLRLVVDGVAVLQAIRQAGLSGRFEIHRYVGDIVGAVAGIDERGRGKRRGGLDGRVLADHDDAVF
jgi:anti-anti-sigma regulatory factor